MSAEQSVPSTVPEPGCRFLPSGVTMCSGGGLKIRRIGKCYGLCHSTSARLVDHVSNSPYYGNVTSCECGDVDDEGLRPRPFERGWRVKAQARFETAWEKALPVGTTEIRDWSDDGGGYLTGATLPDATEATS